MNSKEQFNPQNPEFKTVTDLPEKQKDNFVDTGDGFVYKSAADYGYENAYDDAERIRSVMERYSFADYEDAERVHSIKERDSYDQIKEDSVKRKIKKKK